jgi:hypothetical protein
MAVSAVCEFMARSRKRLGLTVATVNIKRQVFNWERGRLARNEREARTSIGYKRT